MTARAGLTNYSSGSVTCRAQVVVVRSRVQAGARGHGVRDQVKNQARGERRGCHSHVEMPLSPFCMLIPFGKQNRNRFRSTGH